MWSRPDSLETSRKWGDQLLDSLEMTHVPIFTDVGSKGFQKHRQIFSAGFSCFYWAVSTAVQPQTNYTNQCMYIIVICSIIFKLLQISEPLPIFTSETFSLFKMFFVNSVLTCSKMLLQLFLLCTSYFNGTSFYCRCPNYLKCIDTMHFNINIFLIFAYSATLSVYLSNYYKDKAFFKHK